MRASRPSPKLRLRIIADSPEHGIVAQRDECSFGRSRIAFGQRAKEPDVRGAGNGVRPLREDCINRLVERPGVRFPVEFKSCTSSPQSLAAM